MSEIEKMYRNAHIYPKVYGDITKETFENKVFNMTDMCNKAFTVEKQIELIKLLSKVTFTDYFQFFFYEIKEEWVFRLFMITEMSCESVYTYEGRNKNFAEALAGLINNLWQDLTEEEKQQIKEILNG